MPFNYYEIVTYLTIVILILSLYLIFAKKIKALWGLVIFSIPFSAEIMIELPIPELDLPVFFLPTDFLVGILCLVIPTALFLTQSSTKVVKKLTNSRIMKFSTLYFLWMFVSSLTSKHLLVSMKYFSLQIAYFIGYGLLTAYVVYQNPELFIRAYDKYLPISAIFTFFVCVVEHSILGFGKEAVASAIEPFFREHTVYGAFTAWIFVAYFVLWYHKRLSPVLLVTLLFSLAALYLSYSRGAWLTAVGALMLATSLRGLDRISRRQRFFLAGGLGIVGLLGVWYVVTERQAWLQDQLYDLLGDTGQHIASSFDVKHDVSNLGRIHRWRVAIEMFSYSPIFGIGPYCFAEEYSLFKISSDLLRTIQKADLRYAGIHSEYLTSLTEMGILGFILMTTIYIMTLYYPMRFALLSDSRINLILGLVIFTPLLSYYLHAFINNFMDHGKIAALIYMHWGAAIAIESRLRTQHSFRKITELHITK